MISLCSRFLNIWNAVIVTALMFLSANSIICAISGSLMVECIFFFLIMSHISCFFSWWIILNWMQNLWSLLLYCAEYISIYFRCFSRMQMNYLDTVSSFQFTLLSFVRWDQNSPELMLPHSWGKIFLNSLFDIFYEVLLFCFFSKKRKLFVSLFELCKLFLLNFFGSSLPGLSSFFS